MKFLTIALFLAVLAFATATFLYRRPYHGYGRAIADPYSYAYAAPYVSSYAGPYHYGAYSPYGYGGYYGGYGDFGFYKK